MEKKVSSEKVVKLYGLRVIVGTFDKHNPESIYIDGTINLDSTKDDASMSNAKNIVDEALYQWLQEQDDYDRKRYVKVVTYPSASVKSSYRGTTTRIKFDLSLLHKEKHNWKEAVEIASKHLLGMYEHIVRAVVSNGLQLQDFKGYRRKGQSDD